VGAGAGERDITLDEEILAEPARFMDPAALNQKLIKRIRPSLFLSQLPNLLAGNISILFGLTGGSRTCLGEELAGVSAFRVACDLVRDGAYDVALAGGAFNADRPDGLLTDSCGQFLWRSPYQPVWLRSERQGGGLIRGSMAAFLVLEEAQHARARGAAPWCRLFGLSVMHSRRQKGDVCRALQKGWNELHDAGARGRAGIISGATGKSPWTEEEMSALSSIATHLGGRRYEPPAHCSAMGSRRPFHSIWLLLRLFCGIVACTRDSQEIPQIGPISWRSIDCS
jgi:3-oxoacyl-[acyl-carrier-protein] synthase II